MNFNLNCLVYIKRIFVACLISVLAACGGGTDNGNGLTSNGSNGSGVTLSSISITATSNNIAVGGTSRFIATGTYSNGTTADITSRVTWASYYTSYATISSVGLATGVSAGTGYIYASLSGVYSSYYTLTVSSSGGGSSSGSSSGQMGGARQSSAFYLLGTVATVAGVANVTGSTDGTKTAAYFNNPWSITTDGTNLYVADTYNHIIRKIVISSGVVTTLAGAAGVSGNLNGTGTSARFTFPTGVTTDGTNLFVADYSNHSIRKIVISTGVVTTLAGSGVAGSANGTGTAASFNLPYGVTMDATNVYVADTSNNLIRKIVISSGAVTTLAGAGVAGSANGTGTLAYFNNPRGVTTDGTNVYVADYSNHLIRKIVISSGAVTTLAGAGVAGSINGTGTSAYFNTPSGITSDGTNVFVADTGNNLIRKIVISTGVVTTLAGSGSQGATNSTTATSASFYSPAGITTDDTYIYVADTYNHLIRSIY